jgi:ferredoxin--NADP+ reductase
VAYTKVASLPLELEAATEPPLNTYKNKQPYIGTIKSVERIVGPNATGETCHIIIDHNGDVPYWEGQSYGIIPPGENPKKPGTPNTVRLYSIASTRYGDEFDGKTASLCVRRAVYWDPELGAEDPAKKGICSNFLCDSKPGDKVQITGQFFHISYHTNYCPLLVSSSFMSILFPRVSLYYALPNIA